MTKPVTRAELREELSLLATKEEIAKLATKEEIAKLATKEEIAKLATKEEIAKLATKEEIAKLATKDELHALGVQLREELASKRDLEIWGGALQAQIVDLRSEMRQGFAQLSQDMARHFNVAIEESRRMFRTLDDKYADLPERVAHLEDVTGTRREPSR